MKIMVKAAPRGKRPALLVEATLADARIREHAQRMETLHHQLLDRAAAASSPLERARLLKQAHDLHEAAGGLRYSAVTGGDESGVQEAGPWRSSPSTG